jgi:hypothetical protein
MRSSDDPPKSNSERQKLWRDKRKAQGYEMHTIWLDPDVVQGLNRLLDGSQKPQTERIRLINEAIRKMLGAEDYG